MEAIIDGDSPLVITFTLDKIEDPGVAMSALRFLSRLRFPDIVFNDEPEFDEEDVVDNDEAGLAEVVLPPEPAPPVAAVARDARMPSAPHDYTRPPAPGSKHERILDACRRLNTTDYVVIADELDMPSGPAAAAIKWLKLGGHLEETQA